MSPMALTKAGNHKSQVLSSTPPSAASYLSALSKADARARNRPRSPASTPALSLSSSITDESEDTVLNDDDNDDRLQSNADGLAFPPRPPTSEQVFTTVHTEFGHCADERYRCSSAHIPGTQVPVHVAREPPYYILLSTYISYLILICLGHIRDFVGKRLYPAFYAHLTPKDVSFLFSLFLSLSLSLITISTGLCPPKLRF